MYIYIYTCIIICLHYNIVFLLTLLSLVFVSVSLPTFSLYYGCNVRTHVNITGMFSLSALLIRLVSGIGLLTLTATLTDTLALYILPNRKKYRKTIYDEGTATVEYRKNK